jgi:succinate dehydrogenase / fumarate reductase cytochrome b subunit
MKYAFFPGCAVDANSRIIKFASECVADKLGIELVEMPGWSCCGAGQSQSVNDRLTLNMNARNLALAERMKLPILTVCNTCTLALRTTKHKLDHDETLKSQVNSFLAGLDMEYAGTTEVTHILWVVSQPEYMEKVAEKIKTPLKKIRIAPFYGCHILGPADVMSPGACSFNPLTLETMIHSLGAECVDYPNRLSCCGYHATCGNQDIVTSLVCQNLQAAKRANADCIVTPCPLCKMQMNELIPQDQLDNSQNLHCFHLSELLALAMGVRPVELGLDSRIAGNLGL